MYPRERGSPFCVIHAHPLKTEAEALSGGMHYSFSSPLTRTHRVLESLPRVKQHLPALRLIEQVIEYFSLVQSDDSFDEASIRPYLAEHVLPSDQQIDHQGKDRPNGATSKVERHIFSI